jgi:hypothetical protein
MTAKNPKNAMLATLAKLSPPEKKEKANRPIIQEVAQIEPPKKAGRKNHKLEGVEYVRISPALPVELKTEMDVAIRTTHKDYPTIDTFVAEAVRVFLAMKK